MFENIIYQKYNKKLQHYHQGKTLLWSPIDSDIKRHEKIRKLTTGEGENYSTGWLLDYNFIKNHYKLIAVDLSRQNELDVDPKAILQIEFIGQLEVIDDINADGTQNMFTVTILEKNKEMRLKFSQGSVILL